MPLRALFRYLANNEHLVQKLADSYPVRRAAQLAISVFWKGKVKIEDIKLKDPQKVNRLISFFIQFQRNLKDGIQDAKKQLKK